MVFDVVLVVLWFDVISGVVCLGFGIFGGGFMDCELLMEWRLVAYEF